MAPTMMDFMGIKDEARMADMQGESLLPLMKGEVDKIRDWAIAGYHGFSWSLITDEWTYINWLHQDKMVIEGDVGADDIMFEFYDVAEIAMGEGATRDKLRAKEQDEDIWTCTPGATTETPKGDELYNRKEDPWQLDNVIEKHPEKGVEMLKRLREIMLEIKAG